jgi:hypothetical protein
MQLGSERLGIAASIAFSLLSVPAIPTKPCDRCRTSSRANTRSLESLRSCDQHSEAALERVPGDPGFVGASPMPTGGNHRCLNTLTSITGGIAIIVPIMAGAGRHHLRLRFPYVPPPQHRQTSSGLYRATPLTGIASPIRWLDAVDWLHGTGNFDWCAILNRPQNDNLLLYGQFWTCRSDSG